MSYSFENKGITVIIEGVDCAGKSTLIDPLRKVIRGIFWKITDIPKIGNDADKSKIKRYYWKMIETMNHFETTNWIIDRFFPSELVYSKVKRGYEASDDPEFEEVEIAIRNRKHLVVYCDPGLDTIIERLGNRGDDYVVTEELKELYERYDAMYEKLTLNKMRVDTKLPPEEVVKLIGDKLNELYEY